MENNFHFIATIMEVLRLIREILVFIGLCELNGSEAFVRTKWHQRFHFTIILFTIIAMDLSSVIYGWKHVKIGDVENSLYAAVQGSASFCIIGSLITIAWHKKKVGEIFDKFQVLADNCNQ